MTAAVAAMLSAATMAAMPRKYSARTADARAPVNLIGYWEGEYAPGWPNVADFVDKHWDKDERDLIAFYLDHGVVIPFGFFTRLL